MKLVHLVTFSIIGMGVTSLSVLVFTSPQQASSDDLTSNESAVHFAKPASTTPRLSLILEPDTAASITTPRTNSSVDAAPSDAYGNRETRGPLQLSAVDEPCSFSIDGKPVTVDNNVPLMVRIGPHKVKCERPNGDVSETLVEVVEEQITPVAF